MAVLGKIIEIYLLTVKIKRKNFSKNCKIYSFVQTPQI